MLDALPGHERSADVLVATGIAAAGPAAAAGLADWSPRCTSSSSGSASCTRRPTRSALALYSGSLLARVRGDRGTGRLLGYAGLTLIGVSGYLGGHLPTGRPSGANHAEDVPHLVPPGWHDLCAVDDLGPEGEGRLRTLGEGATAVPLLVVRRGDQIDVLSDRCSPPVRPAARGRASTPRRAA